MLPFAGWSAAGVHERRVEEKEWLALLLLIGERSGIAVHLIDMKNNGAADEQLLGFLDVIFVDRQVSTLKKHRSHLKVFVNCVGGLPSGESEAFE
eukprot:253086-Amphidinium_carterae.1